MATVDEILTRQAYAAGDETWTKDNNYPSYHLYVEPEYVPVTNKRIADFNDQVSVRGERNAQFVGFQLPRYDDGIDLTAQHLYIHYQTVYGGGDSVPCNVSWSDNYVRMCWQVPAQATQEPDRVQMMIYAIGTNSAGERTIWKTLPASYTIHDGLDIGGGIPEPDPSWYEQFVAQMEGKVSTAQSYANDAQSSKTAAAGSATAAAESATASAQALEDNKAYVESQKETFVGYNKRDTDLRYANALVGSASGTGRVNIGDAWEAPIPGMDISGRSEQFSTTGAQLLDLSAINKSAAGAVVNYADGGYSISGTGALTASFTASCDLDIKKVLKPGNLILKSELTVPKLYVRIWDGSTLLEEMQGNSTKQITQDMIGNENIRFECFLYATAGNTITPGTYHPMLYQDGDGTWEPYTGGKPSPSPDYPQPIISTGTVSTGAQLLDIPSQAIKTQSGITFSPQADGIVTATGTASGTAWLDLWEPTTLPLGDYYIAGCPSGGSDAKYQIVVYKVNEADYGWVAADNGNGAKFFVADDRPIAVRAILRTGMSGPVIFKPMLNAGDTPKPWEPYTGGKPSPSPEYPQPLDVTVMGEQLFDSNQLKSATVLGIKFTNNGDGSFTVDGTSTGYANISYPISLPPETYSVSGGNNQIKFFVRISENGLTYTDHSNSFTINGDEVWVRVFIQVNPNLTVSETIYPMLNAGPTPLPWQPYQSCTASITLTEPLRGIGDYRDRVMCRDGVWGIERNIGHSKLTSDIVSSASGGVTTSNNVIDNRYTTILCIALKNQIKKGLYSNSIITTGFCNVANPGRVDDWNRGTGGKDNIYTINSAGEIYISIPISSIGVTSDATRGEVIAAVKQYVTDHDVYVAFVLSAPTWEPLPSATQSALNALTSYTGTTHVTVTAGGPEPDVGLGYVQDTRAVIADLQAQIDAIRNGGTI